MKKLLWIPLFFFLSTSFPLDHSTQSPSQQTPNDRQRNRHKAPLSHDGKKFTGNISCRFRCTNSNREERATLTKTFSAEERGLQSGNGGFYGMLTWNLNAWAREWCLDAAIAQCHSIENVREFATTRIASDQWQADFPLECRARNAEVISPFDPGSRSILDPAIAFTEAIAQTRTPLTGNLRPTAENCRVQISAEICGGDCLVGNNGIERSRQTLASQDPHSFGRAQVCADPFVRNYQRTRLSETVLHHFCNEYLFRSAVANQFGPGPSACAATRITPDCSAAIQAIRN